MVSPPRYDPEADRFGYSLMDKFLPVRKLFSNEERGQRVQHYAPLKDNIFSFLSHPLRRAKCNRSMSLGNIPPEISPGNIPGEYFRGIFPGNIPREYSQGIFTGGYSPGNIPGEYSPVCAERKLSAAELPYIPAEYGPRRTPS